VAKIESHDPEVSLDLQMKAIFALEPRPPANLRLSSGSGRPHFGKRSCAHETAGEKRVSPLSFIQARRTLTLWIPPW